MIVAGWRRHRQHTHQRAECRGASSGSGTATGSGSETSSSQPWLLSSRWALCLNKCDSNQLSVICHCFKIKNQNIWHRILVFLSLSIGCHLRFKNFYCFKFFLELLTCRSYFCFIFSGNVTTSLQQVTVFQKNLAQDLWKT